MRKTISTFALIALALLIQPLMPSHVFAAPTSDFNGDGIVNSTDFLLFLGVFGSTRWDGKYDVKYDLNIDGMIETSDFVIFVGDYGKKVPPSGGGTSDDLFALIWNNLPSQPWWRESAPYSCAAEAKITSPWIEAGLKDLGGSDPLSLIRYYGNGSYLRYGGQGFEGCTPMDKYPHRTHLDAPSDPTYYTRGDLDIWIDIARIPPYAQVSDEDNGSRVAMSMAEAVTLMNTHVAPYLQRISGGKLRVTFRAGYDIDVGKLGGGLAGIGWFGRADTYFWDKVADCSAPQGCLWHGGPRGLNRIFSHDVTSYTQANADNGFGRLGLIHLRNANMATILHEIGHGWMEWPHSFTELQSQRYPGGALNAPEPYSNRFDFMSKLTLEDTFGWQQNFPPPLAINRYSAGWIDASDVALHVADSGTYRLSKPLDDGDQLLVIHSGRQYAFTTLEVLPERPAAYVNPTAYVYDPSAPGGQRKFRYDGVLVSRYDQSRGTGAQARFGPALYDTSNPDANYDVSQGWDDYSLIGDGESRDIGNGVTVSVSKNADGSYNVSVSGGKVAAFEPWCYKIWFTANEYDTGCKLDGMF